MAEYVENLLKLSDDVYNTMPAGDFLLESGLLFEINRRILHPLGLAIIAQKNPDGSYSLSNTMIDGRHIAGGLIYDELTLLLAEDALFKYMEEFGVGKMQERQRLRGYVIQKSNAKRESRS